MQVRCLRCKGRGFCGRSFCAVYAKAQARHRVEPLLGREKFFGESPAPFVGRAGYPNISVGVLSPVGHVDNAWEYDAPRHWAAQDYRIPQIIDFRSAMVRSQFRSHVRSPHRFLEISQEVGMASQPVELEIELNKRPRFTVGYDSTNAPMGPSAGMKRAEITSNPKIPRAVDKAVGDSDLKARDAVLELDRNGLDENFLTRLLSVGTLGVRTQRKLVPTRWSITSVDDMLGKHLLEGIRGYPEYDYAAYFGGHLGNYYLICFFPEVYSYELFEMYMPHAEWNTSDELQFMTDYEPYGGRKRYAENCAGGFYAARLGVVQKLEKLRRQASVLVIRVITGEYAVPLGVWVVREAVRKALEVKPIVFGSKELMLKYVEQRIRKKFGFDISQVLGRSVMLRNLRMQTKLSAFA
jgi:hypothetical protein